MNSYNWKTERRDKRQEARSESRNGTKKREICDYFLLVEMTVNHRQKMHVYR